MKYERPFLVQFFSSRLNRNSISLKESVERVSFCRQYKSTRKIYLQKKKSQEKSSKRRKNKFNLIIIIICKYSGVCVGVSFLVHCQNESNFLTIIIFYIVVHIFVVLKLISLADSKSSRSLLTFKWYIHCKCRTSAMKRCLSRRMRQAVASFEYLYSALEKSFFFEFFLEFCFFTLKLLIILYKSPNCKCRFFSVHSLLNG